MLRLSILFEARRSFSTSVLAIEAFSIRIPQCYQKNVCTQTSRLYAHWNQHCCNLKFLFLSNLLFQFLLLCLQEDELKKGTIAISVHFLVLHVADILLETKIVSMKSSRRFRLTAMLWITTPFGWQQGSSTTEPNAYLHEGTRDPSDGQKEKEFHLRQILSCYQQNWWTLFTRLKRFCAIDPKRNLFFAANREQLIWTVALCTYGSQSIMSLALHSKKHLSEQEPHAAVWSLASFRVTK